MQRIPLKHVNGQVYFRLAGAEELDFNNYFTCLGHLLPLLDEPEFKNSTAGFYINYIADPSVDAPKGSCRISYLSVDNPRTMAAIDAFTKKNASAVELFVSWGAYREKSRNIAGTDPERLPFWDSLNDSAHIGLDLITTLGPAAMHAIMLHYGTICMPQGIPPKDFLTPFFERYSPYYQSLVRENLAESYWKDLITWFGSDLPLHFPMNMLLGPNEHALKHLYRTIWPRIAN